MTVIHERSLTDADLQGINLLEVELELNQKQTEEEAAFRLFSAVETADQSVEGSDGITGEIEETENSGDSSPAGDEIDQVKEGNAVSTTSKLTLEKESGREGVCPAPIKEL